MTTPAFYSGTGRRKTAIARVRLLPGEGEIVVNGRSLDEHFGNAVNEADVRMPFRVTSTEGRFNAMIKVEGGGVTGQAGAIRHGIARALLEVDADANRAAASPGRPPDARSAHEGAQEVRPQARPQGAAVHQAVTAVRGRPDARPDAPGVVVRGVASLRRIARPARSLHRTVRLGHLVAAGVAFAVSARASRDRAARRRSVRPSIRRSRGASARPGGRDRTRPHGATVTRWP